MTCNSRGGITLRKKLFGLAIVFAAIVGASAVFTAAPAATKSCPKNTHLVTCGNYTFCCPNNALCICSV